MKILQECTELWTNIRFAVRDKPTISSLTDHVLETILTRVNAKEHTVSLDLTGCENIAGMSAVALCVPACSSESHIRPEDDAINGFHY